MRNVAPFAFVLVCLAGCASGEKQTPKPPDSTGGESQVASTPWQPPEVPPLSPTITPMPQWASTAPEFPWLPGEDTQRSRSIGTVSDGWIVNSVAIPTPHPQMERISSHKPRGLDFSTQEMLELVESAAAHVNDAFPDSRLYLGNFSADGGGDIPYSVSHNSGRDADLAFYMTDSKGNLVAPDDLLSFNKNLKAKDANGNVFSFDLKRNWKLVEGLAKHGKGQIQYVFVSRPLKRALLQEAKRVKADASLVKYADEFLHQPGGALPHGDHFHIRLYCSEVDVQSGCVNGGSKNSQFDAHSDSRSATVRSAETSLGSDDPDVRVAATQRLGLLESRESAGKLAKMLNDSDARARAAAARGLSTMRLKEDAVVERLKQEEDPYVRSELVWALGDYGTKSATKALTALLDKERPVEFDDGATVDLRVLVADVLSVAEDEQPVPALIAMTSSDDQTARFRANRALKMLTNQDPGAKPKASLHQAWSSWWKDNKSKSRDAWLLGGFREFGVKKLSLRYVWDLTYAILDDDHVSYNAQRVMMRLAGREAPSLEWAKSDANFYWRRWFERRCPRLGCPKVPPKLTTLK